MISFSMNPASRATGQAADVETPFRRLVEDFAESKLAVAALFVFVCIVLVAVFSPWISPQNPYDLAEIDILDGRLPPGSKGINGMTYWLGTDDQGRGYVKRHVLWPSHQSGSRGS